MKTEPSSAVSACSCKCLGDWLRQLPPSEPLFSCSVSKTAALLYLKTSRPATILLHQINSTGARRDRRGEHPPANLCALCGLCKILDRGFGCGVAAPGGF